MKTFFRFSIIYFFFLTFFLFSVAQNSPLILNQQVSTGEFVDKEEVKAEPGFEAIPSGSNQVRLYIDENIQNPHNYNSQNVTSTGVASISRELDYSLPVGSTPSIYQVTPSGGLTYNVPIALPPGTKGLVPQLSVGYNSQSGSGLLGSGWTLSGLTGISRAGKTLYHNNTIEAIKLDNTDWFALGGMRLIPVSGANGNDQSQYGTESESYSRVTSFGTIGNGPEWFQIENKDGTTIELGKTNDSRLVPIGKNTVLTWMINKIYDNFGNYISYEYWNSNGEIFIKEIKYTGNVNAGINPYNCVKFYYDTKTESNKIFVKGGELNSSLILRSIKIFSQEEFVKQYKFNFSFYHVYSLLTEIEEFGSDGKKFNSLLFSYGNDFGDFDLNVPTINYLPPYNGFSSSDFPIVKYFPLDYNGDGLKDLVAFYADSYQTSYGSYYYTGLTWKRWSVLKNNGSSTFEEISSFHGDPTNGFTPDFRPVDLFPINQSNIGNMIFSSSDFNGDGKEDVLLTTIAEPSITFNIHLSDGLGYEPSTPSNSFSENVKFTMWAPEQLINIPDNSNNVSVWQVVEGHLASTGNKFAIRLSDFDGDTKLDLLSYNDISTVSPRSSEVKIHLSAATNGNYISLVANTNFNFDRAIQSDIEGDGKIEIVNIYNSISSTQYPEGYYILKYSNGQIEYEIDNSGEAPYLGFFKRTYLGDFNGDGISDMIQCDQVTLDWLLKLGKGDGSYSNFQLNSLGLSNPFDQTSSPLSAENFYFMQDMNNDGKTDIVELIKNIPNSITSINVYYSQGTSFIKNGTIQLNVLINFREDDLNFGDFNGDGNQDLLIYKTEGNWSGNVPMIVYFYQGSNTRDLTEVHNGFNSKTEFEYSRINSDNGVYTQTQPQNFPLNNIGGALKVASRIITDDGVGGNDETIYLYEDGILHRNGKGFLGFFKISTINVGQNYKKVNEYELNSQYFILMQKKLSTYNFSTGNILADELSTFQFNSTFGNFGFKHEPEEIVLNDYLVGTTKTTTFVFSPHGNLLHHAVNVNNGFHITTADYTYTQAGAHIPSKVENCTLTTQSISPSSLISRMTHFDYSSDGLLRTEIQDPNLNNKVTTTFDYDPSSGVMISRSTSSAGLVNINYSYEYDQFQRFVVKEQNPMGQYSEYGYDPRTGRLLFHKGPDGLITRNYFNGFGNIIKTVTPDNLAENIKYELIEPGSVAGDDPLSIIQNIGYSVTNSRLGSPEIKYYYDRLSRVIEVETDGFSNKVYNQVRYDHQGNILQKTGNFETGSTEFLMTTNYFSDLVLPSELVSTEISDGLETLTTNYSHNYSGGNTILNVINSALRPSSRTYDAIGRVISATDDGGTLTYDYFSNGQIKEIKLDGVSNNTMTYDDLGNQTTLDDKDAGLTNYTYNAYGQLIYQKDAEDNVFDEFIYDALGRILQKKDNQHAVYLYAYYDSGDFGVNNIKSITGPNGVMQSYTYDELNRIVSYEENGVPGQSELITTYSYDNLGNLINTIYPGGFTTTNEFNSNGYLTTIKNGSTLIWQADQMNASGQFKMYTSGNGKQTQLMYNNFGLLNQKTTNGVQNIELEFDLNTGNLNWRKDLDKNLTEEFTYDQLNRLTQSQIGNTNLIIDYDILGSIVQKGSMVQKYDAGTYTTFDPVHPNAVQQVTNISNSAISHTPQIITYTDFNSVESIEEGSNLLEFTYGPDQQRRKVELKDAVSNSLISTRIYFPNYEKEIIGTYVRELYYVNTPTGLNAIHVVENGNQGETYFVYTDHLGSILELTDESGITTVEQNFDAWGRRRNPNNWEYDMNGAPTVPDWLYRGFTSHEHLPQFDLINMNGRCYDPVLGMMLSPDNFIQSPLNTQNYNRYTYALNNPLSNIDPNGEYIIPAIMIGFFIGAMTTGYAGGSSGQIMQGAVIGGVAGGAAAYVGNLVPVGFGGFFSGFASGAASGFTAGFIGGGATAWINGASFHDGFVSGMTGAGYGALIGGVVQGTISGIESYSQGRNFFTGEYSELYLRSNGLNLTGNPVAEEDFDKFVDENFGYRINKMEHKPESISINDKMVKRKVAIAQTNEVLDLKYPGKSNIYLKAKALTNDKLTYFTLDHELSHATHISDGTMAYWARNYGYSTAREISEFYAYKNTFDLMIKWGDVSLSRWALQEMNFFKLK